MHYLVLICVLGINFSTLPRSSAQVSECGQSSIPPELIIWDETEPNLEVASLLVAGYLNAGTLIDDDAFQIVMGEFAPDTISFTQYTADVTADNSPEIFVNLMFYRDDGSGLSNGHGFWAVYECQNANYALIMHQELYSYNIKFDPPPGIIAVTDLTNDDIPEIVVYKVRIMGAHGDHAKEVQVYQWNQSEHLFDPLFSEQNSVLLPITSATNILIMDTTGDGMLEILAGTSNANYYTQDFVLPRNGHQVWEWYITDFTNWCEIYTDEPIYRIQAVQDAGAYFDCRRYMDALAAYEQVLTDESLLGADDAQLIDYALPFSAPDENKILAAYAHYRRLLLFVILADMESAQNEYATLQNWTGAGAEYAGLATIFWENYTGADTAEFRPVDFYKGCDAVNNRAEEVGIVTPLAAYPFTSVSPITEVLCPVQPFEPIP